LKHEDPTTITDDGSTIERNLLTEKAYVSICPSFHPCSNPIHWGEITSAKHSWMVTVGRPVRSAILFQIGRID
jgi:hypothetical protein